MLGAKAPKKEPKHLGRIAHPTISSTLSLFRFDFDFGIFSINFAPKIRWGQIGLGRKMNHGCWWFLEVFFCFFLGRCGTANGLPLKWIRQKNHLLLIGALHLFPAWYRKYTFRIKLTFRTWYPGSTPWNAFSAILLGFGLSGREAICCVRTRRISWVFFKIAVMSRRRLAIPRAMVTVLGWWNVWSEMKGERGWSPPTRFGWQFPWKLKTLGTEESTLH